MRENWTIVVNWNTSSEKYINFVLRNPAERYRRGYHITWVMNEKRFARSQTLALHSDKFTPILETIIATANEVALAKRLLAEWNAKNANGQKGPVLA